MRGRPTKEYAIYKGDEFIAIGTIKELAEKTGYAETTLRFCTHPASKKRNKGNRLVVFAVDDEWLVKSLNGNFGERKWLTEQN